MTFMEYRIILTYRVKLDDKGVISGNPELMKKSFVTALNDTKKVKKVTLADKDLSLNTIQEVDL